MTPSLLRNFVVLFDLFVILATTTSAQGPPAVSGETLTTRFWDCCKPSCGWNGKASVTDPVRSCDKNDSPINDFNAGSLCAEGGSATTCTSQQPWAVNDTFSYGFAGVYISGHDKELENFWCCACYQLDFTSDPLKGKTMIVQASNTAYDVKANRFSLAVPGGNTTSDTCAKQFGVEQTVFGEMGSGVTSLENCDSLPDALKPGCEWRFNWFNDTLYPTANFKRVTCPTELTSKTGCIRKDENASSSLSPAITSALVVASFVALLLSA
ncbi:glycoside hydrolase family 45 protein [Amniculicola lignicola CBS 123094]|uniref:cellulase n=1 Tax=Amniculicola lignicola CBS 123094 TaxID=1392246 RepID=A0A6A5WAN4_9PLEO|nr:glycoside hydrolase family 45 protein [Amniculicola lignicola CBS 123094]